MYIQIVKHNNNITEEFYTRYYDIGEHKFQVLYLVSDKMIQDAAETDLTYCQFCGYFYPDDECSCGSDPIILTTDEMNSVLTSTIYKTSMGEHFHITVG